MVCDRCEIEGTTYKYVDKNYCSRCISWLYVDAIGEAEALKSLSCVVEDCLARAKHLNGIEVRSPAEEAPNGEQQKKS